ncbi:Abi family protein [soil metagenome]
MAGISYTQIESQLSRPRLNRYLFAVGNNKIKAVQLYKANLRISKSFYPLINILEIAVRNSFDKVISNHFNDTDWIINQQNGFMSHNSLRQGNFYLKQQISNAIRNLRNRNTTVTSGKVIAEQTFGFWTSLLKPHHYRLLQGKPIYTFPHCPHNYQRNDFLRELNKLRDFRNKIHHNEPVCFSNNTVNFSTAVEIHNLILEVLDWIDGNFGWIKDLDEVMSEIHKASKI